MAGAFVLSTMKKIALTLLSLISVTLASKAQDGFVKTPQGDLVKNITNNAGDKIKVNDVVTFNLTQKTEKDSVLGSTYTMGRPIKIQVQESKNASDLMDIFPVLASKDSAMVKVPTDSLFKGHDDQRPPFLPKGSYLICAIKIERVQTLNDAMAERNKVIDSMKTAETTARNKYITDHKLALKTTASGLQYVITKPSLKAKPLAGDTVQVNYVGKFLDGKLFDTSIKTEAEKGGLNQPGRNYEPYQFVVGKGNVVPGWDEGLLLLGSGAKATFVIPSGLAYGQEGYSDIPPFATLVFDLELVGIKPIKHTPAAAKPGAKKTTVKKHTLTKKKS